MLVGQKIKHLRKKKGLTQKELAEVLELNPTTISHYEKEDRIPSLDILIQIATYFDVDLNYMVGENNIGYSENQKIKMSDEEIELIIEIRKTKSYKNMIASPKNYAKLIDRRTTGYHVEI